MGKTKRINNTADLRFELAERYAAYRDGEDNDGDILKNTIDFSNAICKTFMVDIAAGIKVKSSQNTIDFIIQESKDETKRISLKDELLQSSGSAS